MHGLRGDLDLINMQGFCKQKGYPTAKSSRSAVRITSELVLVKGSTREDEANTRMRNFWGRLQRSMVLGRKLQLNFTME